MDKVKTFLERYVQWLAVALGVAFLGYTCYYYILQKPVSVPAVGSASNVSPAEVDRLVSDGPAETLAKELAKKDAPPPMGPDEALLPHVNHLFELNADDKSIVVSMATPYTPVGPIPAVEAELNEPGLNHEKTLVTQLPTAPPIVDLKVGGGHSNVPAPTAVLASGVPQPSNANGLVQAVDKNWQTIEGTIPTSVLSKAIDDAKIPPNFRQTCILRVELYRQEKNADGSWGISTMVSPLEMNQLQDLPGNNAPPQDQTNYKTWAARTENVTLICQPPFYQVLQGDVWYEPGTSNPNQANMAVIDDGFNPKDPGSFKGDPSILTPKDKVLYDDYLAKKAANAARGKSQPGNRNPYTPPATPGLPPGIGPSGPGGGGGGPSGGNRGRRGLAPDPRRATPGDLLAPPPWQGGPPPGMYGRPPGFQQPPTPGAADTSAAKSTLPPGSFDPGQQPDIKVWAHDATALSGHTYRYMMKYIIANPVAHSQNLCKPQTLADQFSIESADSLWTDPINVESDTNFYATVLKGKGMQFHIFKWKNGVWQMQEVVVSVGDMIGTPDSAGTKTDFKTGWTLVDVRDDPRDEENKTIVLVSDNGTIKKKELTFDQRSAEYHHLLEEANKARAAAAAASPTAPNL